MPKNEEERLFQTNMDGDEYDSISDKYITIPAGPSGEMKVGDSIMVAVEAQIADWKQPGISLQIPLMVIEEGENYGKSIDWYAGISKDAMGITKRALKAFGIEDAVIKKVDGKVAINPAGFEGAKAKARIVRELSNNNNLRSVLDSANFQSLNAGVAEEATATETPAQ